MKRLVGYMYKGKKIKNDNLTILHFLDSISSLLIVLTTKYIARNYEMVVEWLWFSLSLIN